jgi:DNA polymerase
VTLRAGAIFPAGPGVAVAVPTLDFETFSAAGYLWVPELQRWKSLPGLSDQNRGLGTVGVVNYVRHPTFDVLSLAYDLLDDKGTRRWHPVVHPDWGLVDEPHDLLAYIAAGGLLEAWNVGFELRVWNEHCVPKFGWPALRPEQLRCAMAKARSHALPGKLANTGMVLQLPHQKDADGDRLLRKFSVPRNPSKKDPRWRIRPEEDPADAARLYDYNTTDVISEIEASLRTPDLSVQELAIWQLDQKINQRGLQVDVDAVEHCIAIVEQAHAKYNAELRALTNGLVDAATELDKLKVWLGTRGCFMYSMDDDAITSTLERCQQPGAAADGAAVRALQIRQLLGSASIKKLFAFRYQHHAGRLFDLYSYFAARTARWTGNGPQPQNMPKGFFKTVEECEAALAIIAARNLELLEAAYPERNAMEVISSCLRGLLIAAPGHSLICSDFSAIEGVVAACLAGCQWRIDVFRTHGKIYETSAARTTGIAFEEFLRHRIATGHHHPMRNAIGKFTELACGFGGWIAAMKRFGADEFRTDDQLKSDILAWRAASPELPEMWGGQTRGSFNYVREELFGLEGAIISAIKYPGQAFAYRAITYEVHNDILYCRVPSGGLITYHRPRIQRHQRFDWSPPWEVSISYEGWNSNPTMGPVGWVRMDLYGGKAFENVVQRVARDFQATGMLAVEAGGYPIVLHSHDEIMSEVVQGRGTVEHFEQLVNDAAAALPWAQLADGPWPIRMKGGWTGTRYGKFD